MAELILEVLLAFIASVLAGIALYFIQMIFDSYRNNHQR